MGKEVAVAHFEVLSWNLPERTQEKKPIYRVAQKNVYTLYSSISLE